MKVFRFIKKVFFIGLTILSSFINANPLNAVPLNAKKLSCISMNNQPCKARPEIINVSSKNPVFNTFVLRQINVVEIVIILMILTQKYVFLML